MKSELKYKLERAKHDDKWNTFVKSSPNGTIFTYSEYMKSINKNMALYYLLKNDEIRASIALVESDDKKSAVLHDLIIYSGILFGKPQNRQSETQMLSEYFKISSYVAKMLAEMYRNVSFALHPSIVDIRAFLWFNYGKNMPHYTPDIRYTSYVNIDDFANAHSLDEILLYHEASSSRRQEIRNAIKNSVSTKEEFDADLFVEYYKNTMRRQGIEIEINRLHEIKTLMINLSSAGLGKMFVSYTSKGQLGSMAFFAVDNKRAYYVFGANDPDLRNSHTGTAVLWDSFYYFSKNGIKEVDLEGVNSPLRGWFKLSFGGKIIPYYRLTLNQ